MPEGHTAHRLARDQQELVGLRLAVTSPQGRFAAGAARLDGSRLAQVEATGKHLFHSFEEGDHLHVHLGMQGKFIRDESGRPPLAQARARLAVIGRPLAWEVVAPAICEVVDDAGRSLVLDRLGPDPLRPDADPQEAIRRLSAHPRTIGEALLDQSVVAGVGNVLRAEVLFACGIHPRRAAGSLGDGLVGIWQELRATMARAVEEGRIVTVGDEQSTDRASLPESEARYVYKQARCRRCGTPVEVDQLGGRTSYACPRDQPPP